MTLYVESRKSNKVTINCLYKYSSKTFEELRGWADVVEFTLAHDDERHKTILRAVFSLHTGESIIPAEKHRLFLNSCAKLKKMIVTTFERAFVFKGKAHRGVYKTSNARTKQIPANEDSNRMKMPLIGGGSLHTFAHKLICAPMHEKHIGTFNKANGIQVDHQRQIEGSYSINDVPDTTAQNLVSVSVSLNSRNKACNSQYRKDEADKNFPKGVFYDKKECLWTAKLCCKGDTYKANIKASRDNLGACNEICGERLLVEVVELSRVD